MLSKKVIKILESQFEDSFLAIISANKSERASLKKLLVEEGIKLSQIELFDNFKYAKEAMEIKNIPLIIADAQIGETTVESFLEDHCQKYPNRSRTVFICQTQTITSSLKSYLEDNSLDCLLKKPYIVNEAVKEATNAITKKLEKCLDPHYSEFWGLVEKIHKDSFKNLLKIIPQYRIDNPEKMEAIYLEGLFYEKQNLLDESIDRFLEVIDSDPLNINALKKLFELYTKKENFIEVANIGKVIVETFTIHPDQIIKLIKALIVNKDFECITMIAKKYLYKDMEDKVLEQTIAASLAVAGKSGYLRTDPDLFIEYTKLGLEHGKMNPSIIYSCLNNLMDLNHIDVVREFLNKTQIAEDENLFKTIDYRLDEKEENDERIFVKGAELTKSGVHEFHVYDIWLKSAVKTGKKETLIETIIDEAVKYHPIQKDYFLSIKRSI